MNQEENPSPGFFTRANSFINRIFNSNKTSPAVSEEQLLEAVKRYSKEHLVSAHRVLNITLEFIRGFEFLHRYKKAVSIYGSSRLGFKSTIYQQARQLSHRLAKDGFAIITGGGPGIMEAANHGAYDAKGASVGLNISLKHRQKVNQYVIESCEFSHFYVRKTMLSFASKIYIFFPGGFGTLDEFFEMLMLVQTEKIPRIPIILVDRAYWSPLLAWIEDSLYQKNHAIDEKHLHLYHLVDSADEAYGLIQTLLAEKKVPL